MDFCATQKLLQNSSDSQNVFNTLFYRRKIDSYLEQHHILEIVGELMVRVCIDRPVDVVGYLCQTLMEISQKCDVVKLEFHNSAEDGSKMMKTLSAQHRLPLIECVNVGLDPDELRKRLDKFLKRHSLHNRQLIICDFKDTERNEKILRISRTEATRSSKPQDAIDIQLPSDFLNQQQMNYVYASIRQWKPTRIIKANWKLRVLIVGRVGSGRSTQGALMANEFGLKLIRLEIQQHQLSFWGHLQETILKPDALSNGYVIVCNVISKANLQILMEKFAHQPNRIIFLHTSESECRRRCSTMDETRGDEERNLAYQMKLYDLHKKTFAEYMASTGQQIFHIKGNFSVEHIKFMIWSNLGRC